MRSKISTFKLKIAQTLWPRDGLIERSMEPEKRTKVRLEGMGDWKLLTPHKLDLYLSKSSAMGNK